MLAARGQALPRRPRHPRWVEPVLDNLRRRRPEAEWTAELFAARAAIALGNARERENLNQALHSRKVIGQAVGILMERYAMNEDRAFAFLVRVSSHANIKLRDVAQELVNRANAH